MTLRINGYYISEHNQSNEQDTVFFNGVAHIEELRANGDIILDDVEFEGEYHKGQLGFRRFSLEDAEQIENREIREKADLIRNIFSEHLLRSGFEAGEYDRIIPIVDRL